MEICSSAGDIGRLAVDKDGSCRKALLYRQSCCAMLVVPAMVGTDNGNTSGRENCSFGTAVI